MDFYELREKVREKKLLSSIVLCILGLVLLLTSVINSVKDFPLHMSISNRQPGYYVRVDGAIDTSGCFSIESAEVVIQIVDMSGKVLKEETVVTTGACGRFYLDKIYYNISGNPVNVNVKINKIRFNNTWAVILSAGILVVSVVDFILKIKKPKEAQTK